MTDGLEAAQDKRYPRVRGRCPECFGSSLFLGEGGYVTCSRLECTDPTRADSLLNQGAFSAGESALRAAAQELVYGENFGQHVGDCKIDHVRDAECTCYLAPLKAALDGAPWEPSEEQVERAAEAGWRAIDTDDDWALIEEKNRAPWRIFARAAFKAALGLESGSAG